jgi:hypothetical protein
MLFKDIIAFYSENHTRPPPPKKKNVLLTGKAGGTYSYHSALKS